VCERLETGQGERGRECKGRQEVCERLETGQGGREAGSAREGRECVRGQGVCDRVELGQGKRDAGRVRGHERIRSARQDKECKTEGKTVECERAQGDSVGEESE
jgi:hypothetical protein